MLDVRHDTKLDHVRVKTVYWAPADDKNSAIRAADRAGTIIDGKESGWLEDAADNCSDAPAAHVMSSPAKLERALKGLWAARASGKTTGFSLLGVADRSAYPLLPACTSVATTTMAHGPPIEGGPIFFDVTALVTASGTPTGIARVQASLYDAMERQLRERIVPIAWHQKSGRFLQLPKLTVPGCSNELLDQMASDGRALDLSREGRLAGAQILMTGATWARHAAFIRALSRLRLACGAHLSVLIHDLAQLKQRDLYPEATVDAFERNAVRLLRITDRFIVLSSATRTDLREMLRREDLPFIPIHQFRLGSTLERPSAPSQTPGVPAGLEGFVGRPFALFVSSIEPRKNHRTLLKVWRELIDERGEAAPGLICVGRPVIGGRALLDEVAADPVLSRYVRFATGLHDEDLDWCYRHATLTLYPSLYEGWGLPIAESMLYGKVCLSSNTSSMPEVAPGLADLLDPLDVTAWRERIGYYFDQPAALSAREALIASRYQPYSWEGSAAKVAEIMRIPPSSMNPTVVLAPLAQLDMGREREEGVSEDVLRSGWAEPSRAGRAATTEDAEIAFTYLGTQQFVLRLWLAEKSRPLGVANVEARGGRVTATRGRKAGSVNVTVRRDEPYCETVLVLRPVAGLVLRRIDIADTLRDLDSFKPPAENSIVDRLRRRLAGPLGRFRPAVAE